MYISITMGFWRNVGYLWSILMIIFGIFVLPYGLVSIGLGIFLMLYLSWDANDEKIEKARREQV